MTHKTWGRWLRVTKRNEYGDESPRIINLDHVTSVLPVRGGTRFWLSNHDFIDTSEDFEVTCAALMLSEGPRPPLTREEVAQEKKALDFRATVEAAASEWDREG